MISAQQARAQVQAFNLQTDADEAARKAQLALSAPSRDRALNRRIDALVDRFIETAVTPVIDKQASDGSTSVRCFARHYRFRAHTNVDEILTNSMFGKLTYAARRAREDANSWQARDGLHNERAINLALVRRLFDNSSLNRHLVRFWSGGVATEDVTLAFHVLYRAGLRLRAEGFKVTLPEIRRVAGCKVDERLAPLMVSWA